MKAARRRRHEEHGFTLIEVLVSVAILALVAGAVAAAFSVSLKALGAGGAGDRIAGTHDLSAFEQQLGGDIARAACISKSPASSMNSLGTCTAVLAGNPTACTSASSSFLCVSWPAWTQNKCHTAVYSKSGAVVTRVEYGGPSPVTTHVASDAISASVTLSTVSSPSNPSKKWVSLVTIPLTSLGVDATKRPPSGSLYLHPMTTDPTTASVTSIC